jgi:hypothetical protein
MQVLALYAEGSEFPTRLVGRLALGGFEDEQSSRVLMSDVRIAMSTLNEIPSESDKRRSAAYMAK